MTFGEVAIASFEGQAIREARYDLSRVLIRW